MVSKQLPPIAVFVVTYGGMALGGLPWLRIEPSEPMRRLEKVDIPPGGSAVMAHSPTSVGTLRLGTTRS
jgi:hypothetical protein